MQWLSEQPSVLHESIEDFFENKSEAQDRAERAHQRLLKQALQTGQVDQLMLENRQLRDLLALRARVGTSSLAAEVIYDAADPFTRVLTLYLESVSDGRRFVAEAGKITPRKPIIALKVGRFASGQRAAAQRFVGGGQNFLFCHLSNCHDTTQFNASASFSLP